MICYQNKFLIRVLAGTSWRKIIFQTAYNDTQQTESLVFSQSILGHPGLPATSHANEMATRDLHTTAT